MINRADGSAFRFMTFCIRAGRIEKYYIPPRVNPKGRRDRMAAVKIFKRNETFVALAHLVGAPGNVGITETLEKYDKKPMAHKAMSIPDLSNS